MKEFKSNAGLQRYLEQEPDNGFSDFIEDVFQEFDEDF